MTNDNHGNLQVTGTGKVQVAPDEAIVHLGVVTDGKTATEAATSNAARTQAMISAITKQPNHGVTTVGLGVNPIMSYDPQTNVGTIVGFRATNGVEVKTKVGFAGQIYDAGIAAGATESSGITFQVQNESPHREEALRLAFEQASKEAHIVARAAKVELEGPTSIQIEPGGGRTFYRSEALNAKAIATPVIPEDRTITASVHVVFRTGPRRGA